MLRNVVSETSDIMASCARGDVSAVKALFISGKASPYDMTISNSSPLRVSIVYANQDLHILTRPFSMPSKVARCN